MSQVRPAPKVRRAPPRPGVRIVGGYIDGCEVAVNIEGVSDVLIDGLTVANTPTAVRARNANRLTVRGVEHHL